MPHTRKELLSWAKDAWEKITGHKEEEVTIKGWAARGNSINGLCLFTRVKPVKYEKAGIWNGDGSIFIPDEMLPSVQWSDPEPTPATITIKIEK